MNPVKIISASAGTGKTTRLARIISEHVANGTARPEAVLATTFTKRAAAELAERARSKLLEAGESEKAQRLQAARIGTVNGVCGALVQDFAFDQGLSPRVTVLDKDQADLELKRVGGQTMPPELLTEIGELEQKFGRNGWDWHDAAVEIVKFARTNAIGADRFSEMADSSVAGVLSLYSGESADAAKLDQALASALRLYPAAIDLEVDTTKTTANALRNIEAAKKRGIEKLTWSDWAGLANDNFGKKSEVAREPLAEAASAHHRHPRLKDDVSRATHAVFRAAQSMLEAYQSHKQRLGVIDFIDQETYALELLRKPEIRDRLASEIDLVLVDEFQDTSPLQLAIFLELAKIAPHTVWVGDPKQAIYGFRGADPSLMEAAVSKLLDGEQPETLDKSYRSRPELVRLTSDLFSPAFAQAGIDESLVRIEPGHPTEPEGLGSILEQWILEPGVNPKTGKDQKNVSNDCSSIAEGVAQYLADPKSQVRDPGTREVRDPMAGDIGILCFTNDHCNGVADELARRGIRAVVGRPGLVNTLESRLAIAALSLWVDADNTLARAELGRWLGADESGDGWLSKILDRAKGEALFDNEPSVAGVVHERQARPDIGVLAAFDAALSTLGIREEVVRFGESTMRLSNLDALRAQAARYVDRCRSEGLPCTLQGLLANFDQLASDEEDAQAAAKRPDSVLISTWHGAKGLEWPVTVLADIKKETSSNALGVQLVSEREEFDVDDPLGGRTIRYWMSPYGKKSSKIPFVERVDEHEATQRVRERARREALRLIYVGWTRARDTLVLAGRPNHLEGGRLSVLAANDELLLSEPNEKNEASWGVDGNKVKVNLLVRNLPPTISAKESSTKTNGTTKAYQPVGPQTFPLATSSPSSISDSGKVVRVVEIGERIAIQVSGDDGMRKFGEAVHGFLAADRTAYDSVDRKSMAEGLLQRWDVAGAVAPSDLLAASERLTSWSEENWPGARWRREWPIEQRLKGGTILRGTADLVLETDAGFVLIDHKSFPGSRDQAGKRAVAYAGQLAAYAAAISEATGKEMISTYIHLPISGIVVEIAFADT